MFIHQQIHLLNKKNQHSRRYTYMCEVFFNQISNRITIIKTFELVAIFVLRQNLWNKSESAKESFFFSF